VEAQSDGEKNQEGRGVTLLVKEGTCRELKSKELHPEHGPM
jgi:hypothetical protein